MNQRGFSLLEVIAAILLLAITFTALLKVAGNSIELSSKAAQRSNAALWARTKLDTTLVLPPRQGQSEGRFDATYRWRLLVTPQTAGNIPPGTNLYRLDLEVLWGKAPHQYSTHFSTLRLYTAAQQGSL